MLVEALVEADRAQHVRRAPVLAGGVERLRIAEALIVARLPFREALQVALVGGDGVSKLLRRPSLLLLQLEPARMVVLNGPLQALARFLHRHVARLLLRIRARPGRSLVVFHQHSLTHARGLIHLLLPDEDVDEFELDFGRVAERRVGVEQQLVGTLGGLERRPLLLHQRQPMHQRRGIGPWQLAALLRAQEGDERVGPSRVGVHARQHLEDLLIEIRALRFLLLDVLQRGASRAGEEEDRRRGEFAAFLFHALALAA